MVLRDVRNFRRIWTGQVVSVVGDGMQRIALLWWARRSGGNALLTAVALSTMLPVVAGSPIGGWLADRFDRRRLLLIADVTRVVTTAALAAAIVARHPSALLVCGLVAIAAGATAVFEPTYAAAVPTLVDAEQRQAANGLNMANSAVGGLLGPLLGGVLIAGFGVGTVLAVNAVTFAWSAICIARARVPRPSGAGAEARARHTSRAAMASVVTDRGLRRLVGLASALNLAAAPLPVLVVALALDRFHAGSRGYGLLEVMVSAGILVGAITVGRLAASFAVARTVVIPMLVLGGCLSVAGLLPFVGTALAFAVGGVAIAVGNTALLTSLQESVDEEVQGRVFGVATALGEGLRPAGLALAAPLLLVVGVSGAFVVAGAGIVLATLAWGRPPRTVGPIAKVLPRIDGEGPQPEARTAV